MGTSPSGCQSEIAVYYVSMSVRQQCCAAIAKGINGKQGYSTRGKVSAGAVQLLGQIMTLGVVRSNDSSSFVVRILLARAFRSSPG